MKWRKLLFLTGISLTVGAVLPGCGSDDGDTQSEERPPTNPDGGKHDGGKYEPPANAAPVLRIVGDSAKTLGFNESTELRVRYVDGNNKDAALPNAAVAFSMQDGDTAGSALSAAYAVTDTQGEAQIKLTAGKTNTKFNVIAKVDDGKSAPVTFNIVISDQPFGNMDVSFEYDGQLDLIELETRVLDNTACDGLTAKNIPTPMFNKTADSVNKTLSFAKVPAMANYAVATTAKIGSLVRAFGCVDKKEVLQGETLDVVVPLQEIEWAGPVSGEYELVNTLNFGKTLPGSLGTVLETLYEVTDDKAVNAGCEPDKEYYGTDPGAFLTDFVMRQTCAWECDPTDDYNSCNEKGLKNHPWGDLKLLCTEDFMSWDHARPRITGACGAWEAASPFVQKQINSFVEKNVPDFVKVFLNLAGDISGIFTNAKIKSTLTVQADDGKEKPMTHQLQVMQVKLHDFKNVEQIVDVDLAKAGLKSKAVSSKLSIEEDAVTIPQHSFEINFGELVKYIYLEKALPLLGYKSSAELFRKLVDCKKIAEIVAEKTPVNATDAEKYCGIAIEAAGSTFDSQIFKLIKANGTLSLEGTCDAADHNEDGIAKSLTNGIWNGTWGEEEKKGNVKGTFKGTRKD